MKPSNLLSRVMAERAAADGGGSALVILAADQASGEAATLRTWDDATNEAVRWGFHFVNEQAGGKLVDYVHGFVFADRQQMATALFDNDAVLVEREEEDW